MNPFTISKTHWAALFALVAMSPVAQAHFLWVAIEPGQGTGPARVRAFFNEQPEPDAEFTKYVRDVRLVVDGQAIESQLGKESRDGKWLGRHPILVDSDLDLGVSARGPKPFRLIYSARAQSEPLPATTKERASRLRVRARNDEKDRVEVLFDGKPLAQARIRVYPNEGSPSQLKADDQGQATVPGLSAGKVALWANWSDGKPGEVGGKKFAETRHYATLTFAPAASNSAASATSFATLPEPAVTSLGAAVLGNWLYVYSGHTGQTHHYNVNTTSKHFRRLNLENRSTWQDLPMGPDLQGLSLVSDGKFLYRIGGMFARNKPDEEQDMVSVADFARFDPVSKEWKSLPSMPEPRSTHDTAVLGRSVYVMGGWTMKGASEESTFLDHGLVFNLDRPEAGWKTIPQPFQRRALAVAAHDGKIFVLGGLLGGGMKVDRRVDVYDPANGTWSRGPSLPAGGKSEGFASSAFDLDGRLYITGASGTLFRLNPAGDTWEAVGAFSHPRIAHRLLPTARHSLIAVGGNSKGRITIVIEAIHLTEEGPAIRAAAASGN